jgi:hypothetical protein
LKFTDVSFFQDKNVVTLLYLKKLSYLKILICNSCSAHLQEKRLPAAGLPLRELLRVSLLLLHRQHPRPLSQSGGGGGHNDQSYGGSRRNRSGYGS